MQNLHGNWVDLIIILILFYFFLDSFRHNLFVLVIEFLSFLLSLLLGFRFYGFVAQLFVVQFAIPGSISKALGFFIIVVVSEALSSFLFFLILRKIPTYIKNIKFLNYPRFVIGLMDGILLISFLIPLVLAFPVSVLVKDSILQSKLGKLVYNNTLVFEKNYQDVFGGIVNEGLNLLTVSSKSEVSVPIHVSSLNLSIDYENEESMVNLVNLERGKVGVAPLTLREEMLPIARNYAMDMWTRGYFSHYSPEGKDVSNRLDNAGISYQIVGENLALAPTLVVAHSGLMNSEEHKRNILDPLYKHIAIGIIDNGSYGKIFVQIFTD